MSRVSITATLSALILACLFAIPFPGAGSAIIAQAASAPAGVGVSLEWNTFLGANSALWAGKIATDARGNSYAVGLSGVAWGAPIRPYTGERDVLVAKLDAAGNLVWMTFLGGANMDHIPDIALSENGDIYVAGISLSAWTCQGAPCTVRPHSASDPTFVAKLDSDGVLLWNTFLGGDTVGVDYLFVSVAVAGQDSVYVSGSGRHPWGTPLRPHSGNVDAFVAKIDTDGNLLWNTFLGGSAKDMGNDIAADRWGNAYIAGYSGTGWSCDDTPPSCMVRPYVGSDAFVAKLGPNGSLLWNSFLGGSRTDIGFGIAVDSQNQILLTGSSTGTWGSPIHPLTEGKAFTYWTDDIFAAKLDLDGNLVWNTFFGTRGYDEGYQIAQSSRGYSYIVGSSAAAWGSSPLPFVGETDAVAAGFDADGNLLWNIFLGSSRTDQAYGVAIDADNHILVSGFSDGKWGSPVGPYSGKPCVFVAQLSPDFVPVWLPLAAE